MELLTFLTLNMAPGEPARGCGQFQARSGGLLTRLADAAQGAGFLSEAEEAGRQEAQRPLTNRQ